MKSTRNYLFLLLYSLSLIPIWGYTMLSASENTNEFSAFLGYAFTVYTLYLLKKTETYQQARYAYLWVMVGPVLYMIVGFTAQPWQALLVNKITFAFLLTAIVLAFRNIELKSTGVVLLFACYFYPYHIDGYQPIPYLSALDKIEINKRNLNEDLNLSDFAFLDARLDTIKLPLEKPLLIETWNETCRPCIASIMDLEPFIENLDLKHVYLYEALGETRLKPEKILQFKFIKNKDKIFIDANDHFLEELGMKSYPYFLMFDKNGKLVDYFAGYAPPFKDYFQERIVEMYQKANAAK
ncbi:TlpA family protein disulfide reductase [Hugenholtzia roseola]|uniref:TlpA family protein disulfide reductase n=1 Tax=Hugenholtzia roseola TaxID=1002 RepID=UPI00047C8D95|nr:thioredoxin family protein [Hugenholtzia roseola]